MEEWRDIVGYEGAYIVSSIGRVQRVDTNTILKPYKCKDGYLHAVLYRRNKRANKRISRLVCEAFNGPPPFPSAMALHKDGIGNNDTPGNLYWGTHDENMMDLKRHNVERKG